MSIVRPIPQGYHSITPMLVCKGAAKAIDFYKEVFNAKENGRMEGPGVDRPCGSHHRGFASDAER